MERHFHLVIITGVSGSGKSTALDAFEDVGYFCVDNLPSALIPNFVEFLKGLPAKHAADCALPANSAVDFALSGAEHSKFALLVDCRDKESAPLIQTAMLEMIKAGTEVTLLFFDCQDEVAIRRFQETRRPHPILAARAAGVTIKEALTAERQLLSDFRGVATKVIDTSAYSPHDLRRVVVEHARTDVVAASRLSLVLQSFGFKYGLPVDADIIMDVRFLPNPHFVPELRELSGLEGSVSDYVFQSDEADEFVRRFSEMLRFLIPRYQLEGKRYLTVGIGCTGGRHRSVAIVEKLNAKLGDMNALISVFHRDLPKDPAGRSQC